MSTPRALFAAVFVAAAACNDAAPSLGAAAGPDAGTGLADARVTDAHAGDAHAAHDEDARSASASGDAAAPTDGAVRAARDAGPRTRPDGGYPVPCDPDTGRWAVLPDPLLYNNDRVTAYVVDFPNRRVVGKSELTLPQGRGGDNWKGEIDLEQLESSPTCDQLANYFLVLVEYDEDGNVSGASTEDLFLRGITGFYNISGIEVASCRLDGSITAEVTATSRVELFAWDMSQELLSAPVALPRTGASGTLADFTVQVSPVPFCGPQKPGVYILVDHDGDRIVGLYTTAG